MTSFQTKTPSEMAHNDFIATFGGIYEHSEWIASRVWESGITAADNEVANLQSRMKETFMSASDEEKLGVILAHPDLAGRAAIRGELTESSTSEQAGAGIDKCTLEEFRAFARFNDSYKTKFGFPFIMAVKGADRHLILAAFERRLKNSREDELETALEEINKIAAFRLAEL